MMNRNGQTEVNRKHFTGRRLLAFLSAVMLMISSGGLSALAEAPEIISAPVTAPVHPEAAITPAPAEEGGENGEDAVPPEDGQESVEEPEPEDEPEAEPEVTETPEPEDDTVYEAGTLSAETEDCRIRIDYSAEARIPEGSTLSFARAKGAELYSAMKSAARTLRQEENESWKRELADEGSVFYTATIISPEGEAVQPSAEVELTYEEKQSPQNVVYFMTGDHEGVIDVSNGSYHTTHYLLDPFGYGKVVLTQTAAITLTYDGPDFQVTASYGPEAGFPSDTALAVREIKPGTPEYETYSGLTDEALSEDWNEITLERYFDITFVSGGKELEPQADVDVQILFKEAIELTDEHDVQAVHIENNEATVIASDTDSNEAAKNDAEAIDTVTFTSDSFSVYGVVQRKKITQKVLAADGQTYEINVTYGPEANIPEDAQLRVEEIPEGSELWEAYRKQTAAALGADDVRLPGLYDITILDAEGREVEPAAPLNVSIRLINAESSQEDIHVVHFTEEIPEELVEAAGQENPEEIQPLTEEQQIRSEHLTDAVTEGDTVTFETDGFSVYAFAYTIEVYYKIATGETYRIRLDYNEDSGIPAGSVLKVNELKAGTTEYDDYLTRTAEALDREASEFTGAHFFDIEILKDGEKIEPVGSVSVSVRLDEMPTEEEDVSILHFQAQGIDQIDGVTVTEESILFEAESFSVYAVITTPREGLPQMDGRIASISRNGYYMTAKTDTNSSPNRILKSNNPAEAATWYFESAGNNEYYIYTLDQNGNKQYINITQNPSTTTNCHVTLSGNRQALRVESCGNNEYKIRTTIGVVTYSINHWNNGNGNGFAAYYQNSNGWDNPDEHLKITFLTPDKTNSRSRHYAVIIKYNGQYYAVQNDGTLEPVNYDAATNRVEMENPILWEYISVQADKDATYEPYNLRIAAEAAKYESAVASEYYYRYISPRDNSDGIEEENAGTGSLAWGCGLRYKQNEHRLVNIGNWNGSSYTEYDYIGVTTDANGKLRIIGGKSANEAAEVYLAEALEVAQPSSGTHNDHTVNHIDISIEGKTDLRVPVEPGEYTDQAGNVIYTATDKDHFIKMTGIEVDVDSDDLMKAQIKAYTKKNGEMTELHNAFYVTGYSSNQANDTSTVQVRVEGSFKVADLPPCDNADNEQAVRTARLNNRIYYTVSTVKKVTFTLQKDGKDLYKDGQPVTVTVPVTLSASFNYWDSRNECPPVSWSNSDWASGKIIGEGTLMSGMDFKLGASVEQPDKPTIQITKYVQDSSGKLIKVRGDYSPDFDVMYNASGDVSSVNNKLTDYTVNPEPSGYVNIHDKVVEAGGTGMGSIKDFDIPGGGMVYIREKQDSVPQTITDENNVVYEYVRTEIDTEFTNRSGNNEEFHTSNGLISVAEVTGTYAGRNNPCLDFYVKNIYKPVTTIQVTKNWEGASAPDGATVDVVVKRYKIGEPGSVPATDPSQTGGEEPGEQPGGSSNSGSDSTVTVNCSIVNIWNPDIQKTRDVQVPAGKQVTVLIDTKGGWDRYQEKSSVDTGSGISIKDIQHENDRISVTFTASPTDEDRSLTIKINIGTSDDVKDINVTYSNTSDLKQTNHHPTLGLMSLLIPSASADEAIALHLPSSAPDNPPENGVPDESWSEIVTLNGDGWTKELTVDAVDENGNPYVYYIDEVREYGISDTTHWNAEKDGQLVWGNETSGILSVTNTYFVPQAGGVTVSKAVTGNAANPDQTFEFTLSALKADNSPIEDGTYGDATFTSGSASFALKGGQSKTLSGLPIGTQVTVTESSQGYTATYTINGGEAQDGSSANVTINNTTQTVAFVNELNTYGNITLKKTVSGTDPDNDKEFVFTVYALNDDDSINTDYNGTYGDATFINGAAELTLTAADINPKQMTGLPNGMKFRIIEADYTYDDYILSAVEGNGVQADGRVITGTVIGNSTIAITANNEKTETVNITATKQFADIGDMTPPAAIKLGIYIMRDNDLNGTPVTADAYGNVIEQEKIICSGNASTEETQSIWEQKAEWTHLPVPDEGYRYFIKETALYYGELTDGSVPAGAEWITDSAVLSNLFEQEGGVVSFDENDTHNGHATITNRPKEVSIPVEKTWDNLPGNYDWTATFKLQSAPLYEGETAPAAAYTDVVPERTITVTSEQMKNPAASLHDRSFMNLPKYGVDEDGRVYRILYSVAETGYTITDNGTPVNEQYNPSLTHIAGMTGTTDTDYAIQVTNFKQGSYNPLFVKKHWHDIEDPDNYPEIRFTLYQGVIRDVVEYPNGVATTVTKVSEGSVFVSESGQSFVDIPLNKNNNWTWKCPVELPSENADHQPVGYYVVENTGNGLNGRQALLYQNSTPDHPGALIDTSSQNYGQVMIWDYYNSANSNHAYRNDQQQPKGWDGGITASSGTLTIVNRAPKYKQIDIKKKIMEYINGSLYTTTNNTSRTRNFVLEIQLYRRTYTLDQTGQNATPLVDWEKYGTAFMVGYGPNGESIEINNNEFDIGHSLSGWHWTIMDNNQENGLPAYGYYQKENGEYIPVRYRYIPFEIGAYANTNRDPYFNGTDYEWMIGLQPAAWDGDGSQYETFPRIQVGQDQDRLMNIQATDLLIEKVWDHMPSNITEVYVKLYRQKNGDSSVEDFTNDISRRTDAFRFYGIVEDSTRLQMINDGVVVLGLTPQNASVLIHGVPLSPVLDGGSDLNNNYYRYWIEEIGYKDSDGNIYNASTTSFFPQYDQSDIASGAYKDAWTDTAENNQLKLGTKGKNKLRIKNYPTMNIDVQKLWKDKEGNILTGPWNQPGTDTPVTTSIRFKVKRNDSEYLTFNGSETLEISTYGQRAVVKTAVNGGTAYTVSYVPDSDDKASIGNWKTIVHGLQMYSPDNDEYTYTIEELTDQDGKPLNQENQGIDYCSSTISADGEHFTILNEQITNSLVIRKTFSGNASGELTDQQKAHIQFQVTGPNGYNATFTYGVDDTTRFATWSGDTLTIKNIAAGTYTVKELNHNPASVFGDGTEGADYLHSWSYQVLTTTTEGTKNETGVQAAVPDNGSATVEVENRYDKATLEITKTVSITHVDGTTSNELPEGETVTFTVTPADGLSRSVFTYPDDFEDGRLVLTQADGILPNTEYTVTETNADLDRYTRTTVIKANGGEETSYLQDNTNDPAATAKTEIDGYKATAEFTNEYEEIPFGSLKITKAIAEGSDQETEDVFTFSVKLTTDGTTPYTEEVKVTSEGGTATSVTPDANGIVTVTTIGAGEALIEDLPDGIHYEITETPATGWKLVGDNGVTGTITAGEEAGATFTNKQLAQLTLTKTISGVAEADLASVAGTVSFTVKDSDGNVKLGPTALNDQIFSADGTTYTATLTSENYDWIIPKGAYTVEETTTDAEGYILTSTTYMVNAGTAVNGKAGGLTLSDGSPSLGQIDFTNTYEPATTDITVIKKDEDGAKTLPGATFRLTKLAQSGEEWTETSTVINSAETNGEGKVTISGLTPGRWRLTETKAPAGYVLTTETLDIEVKVENNAVTVSEADSIEHQMITFTDKDNIVVKNTPGALLPSTGGSGTLPYILAGMTLMLLAGVILVSRKKRNQN